MLRQGLGTGTFHEPSQQSLRQVGVMMTLNRFCSLCKEPDPFESVELIAYTNVVLAFAGNSQLTSDASSITGTTSAGKLLTADLIKAGSSGLFPGYAAYKQLVWLVVPSLVLLHTLGVYISSSERPFDYISRGLYRATVDTPLKKILQCTLKPSLAFGLSGALLVVWNVFSPGVYSVCQDPIAMASIAHVSMGTFYQWVWTGFASAHLFTISYFFEQLSTAKISQRAGAVHRTLTLFGSSPVARAIDNWCQQKPRRDKAWRIGIFWILLVFAQAIAITPAFCFVLAIK